MKIFPPEFWTICAENPLAVHVLRTKSSASDCRISRTLILYTSQANAANLSQTPTYLTLLSSGASKQFCAFSSSISLLLFFISSFVGGLTLIGGVVPYCFGGLHRCQNHGEE